MFVTCQLNNTVAQKQPKLLSIKGNTNCVYKAKYSAKQRHQFYLFNTANTIKLISFSYKNSKYPFTNDTLINDSLIEVKTLSKIETDQLTDIIYNNIYKKNPNYGTIRQCWIPHNAILFLDKQGKLKEFISICFHCDRYKGSSEKINLGDDCDQKMGKLRLYFVSLGVKFGTDPNIEYGGGQEEGIISPPAN